MHDKGESLCRAPGSWRSSYAACAAAGRRTQIQRSSPVLVMAAGPRVRAGLKEPEEKGESTVSSVANVTPIASGAAQCALAIAHVMLVLC